jgi:hypothetical protein
MNPGAIDLGLVPIGRKELEGVPLDGIGVLGDDRPVIVEVSVVDLGPGWCEKRSAEPDRQGGRA